MKKTLLIAIFLLPALCAGLVHTVHAADDEASQVLSVTPPLFQIQVAPKDIWKSAIKVVNGNPYELTIYAELVDFAPQGEEGQGRFIPVNRDDEDRSTLAEWLEMASGPFVIPPEQTMEIPFFIEVPENAPPGGHFAAALISTQPPAAGTQGSFSVTTSQAVTTLIFARIAGDVIENGAIREFSVTDAFPEKPEAEFSLRFENKGNVHLQPRGDIVITNMWGTERGVIPINQQTHFGNVLPQSIRDFRFTWAGESSLTDIGRYKAEATVVYGQDGINNTTAITYFWVVPVKATLITLGILIAFIYFVTWIIKLYIRRMLALAGVDVRTMEHIGTVHTMRDDRDVRLASYTTVSAPLRSGARDLRDRLRGVTEFIDMVKTLGEFVLMYKLFFISMVVLIAGFVGIVLYISDASETDRAYEVRIKEGESERVIYSDEGHTDEAAPVQE